MKVSDFKKGDIVAGPFFCHPLPGEFCINQSLYGGRVIYGIGFGIVTHTLGTFVYVDVIQGDRMSGGYTPDLLTHIPNAIAPAYSEVPK